MANSDAEIRASIKAEVVAVAPLALVFDYWPLGVRENEWPGVMRSAADDGKAHAWIITRRSMETQRKVGAGSHVTKKPTYFLMFFHWYDEGSTGLSESLFSAEIDAVVDGVSSDAGVQVPLIDLGPFGTEHLHFAVLELTRTNC